MRCKMMLLTVQTSHLFTHPSPARAALIDYVKVQAVHLFVRCVVCCPEEEKFCSSHIRGFSGSSFSKIHSYSFILQNTHQTCLLRRPYGRENIG